MQILKTFYKNKIRFYWFALQLLLANLFICLYSFTANAQSCPPNIDFETGTFNGWTSYTGSVAGINGQNIISITPSNGPAGGRQTMYSANPGDGVDPYGGFPVNCPNGSGHSIRLGNNSGGGEAEGISYEFTIPANESIYTLIYNYAVVFQDPNHLEFQQPRMEIEITNVTDNTLISCSSFSFHPFGTPLPGFEVSPNPGSETPVYFKNWTAVSINLNGNAGKKIKLFFKTADCTFRRHFGYAYIDVNSECSGTFTGATYCPGDTLVNVLAPYGYQSYTWYDSALTQVLGKAQVLTLKPPPAAGTTYAVKLNPYSGYGCPQTLYTKLVDTLTVTANAGLDTFSCNSSPVQIGSPPKPGLVYRWSPATGLSNANIANPYASPDTTTTFILTVNHDGGGCLDTDTVVVKASSINNSLQLIGNAAICIGSNDSAILKVQLSDSIQWFKDKIPVNGAHQTLFRVTQTGTYHAMLYNNAGCNVTTNNKQINISSVPDASFTPPANSNQCLVGNEFIFSNSSTNVVGTMQYKWILGDGAELNTRDLSYSYTRAGIYNVKLIVNTNSVCSDSSIQPVEIFQNAIANFSVKAACINLPIQPQNNTVDTMNSTVNYVWDLGNSKISNLRNPPAQTYPVTGTYSISLSVNTAQCPSPLNTVKHIVVIDKPKPGITYPLQYAVINLPLPLQARQIGESALWSPGINLDTRTSFTPTFKGASDQLYSIEIKTNIGCVTVDTQLVKTVDHVEVYVPTAFTPNNDGKNDFLHPILLGIKEVRYFRVYNRWGQLLFESRNDKPGWNGTFKGIQQQTQTVVWMIEGIGVDGNIHNRKGTTVLLR